MSCCYVCQKELVEVRVELTCRGTLPDGPFLRSLGQGLCSFKCARELLHTVAEQLPGGHEHCTCLDCVTAGEPTH